MKKCDRCGKEMQMYKMSYFNEDEICSSCLKEEEQHPLYAKAKQVELEHVKNGDYNFPGIGLPNDLAAKYKK